MYLFINVKKMQQIDFKLINDLALHTHTQLFFLVPLSVTFNDMYLSLPKRVLNHTQGVGVMSLKK